MKFFPLKRGWMRVHHAAALLLLVWLTGCAAGSVVRLETGREPPVVFTPHSGEPGPAEVGQYKFRAHRAGATARSGARRGWRPLCAGRAPRPQGGARHGGPLRLGASRGLICWPPQRADGRHTLKVVRCPGPYPALRSGRFEVTQGPKMNQIQWTVLDPPGRKATPLFRGETGRAACGPSRDQIRLCGFDSRRLQLSPAEAGC